MSVSSTSLYIVSGCIKCIISQLNVIMLIGMDMNISNQDVDPGLHLYAAVVVQDDAVCSHLSRYISTERTVLGFPAGLLVQVGFRHELGVNHHSLWN